MPCARARLLSLLCLALGWNLLGSGAITSPPTACAQIVEPPAPEEHPIAISADRAIKWEQGQYEVWVLTGHCAIEQGTVSTRSEQAVLWVKRASIFSREPHRVIAYLEDGVTVDYADPTGGENSSRITDSKWLGNFNSVASVEVRVPAPSPPAGELPEIYRRAMIEREFPASNVQQAQFIQTQPEVVPAPAAQPAGRRIHAVPRSSVPVQIESVAGSREGETAIVISAGVNIVIEGLDSLGTVEIEADRMVIWTQGLNGLNLLGGASQREDMPLELYMEGNIVFRQADRVIYAQAMYYNVANEFGVVLQAEMLTPVPDYDGLLRVKADVLQQFDRQNFQASGAAVTSSRLGVPRYWFQAETVEFQDIPMQLTNPFTGLPEVDPITGQPLIDHELRATSRDNLVYMGGVPVFYWPRMATDLTKPNFYLDGLSIRSDSIFGFQVLTSWDMYQLLGIREPPEGTDWTTSIDYLSERGPALGTTFTYSRYGSFGLPGGIAGPYNGWFDAWGILEQGLDDLDTIRRGMVPESGDLRGRAIWRHTHLLPDGYQIKAQAGLISDRNFLEQYFEEEWDTFKDEITGVQLSRIVDNRSWSLAADVRLNDFFMQTEQLPRFDHFWLGQSLLGERLTWNEHSNIGYLRQETATFPLSPPDAASWTPLPWEVPVDGVRAATRQELALPLSAGPVEVVPYVLGELAYWGEDLTGDEITRAYGQVGVRASMPIWRVDPTVCSTLWNLNGLAHKVSFEGELLYADADQDLSAFPLYDPLDDDSQEHFRRRMVTDSFGGFMPYMYDSRSYALRYGMQSWVTGPTEIADDMMQARFGIRQRWQTKRGLPGNERIIDWITFDVQAAIFPDADRDNFGAPLGMVDYDFRWHVGDRVAILSDGYFDTFSQGLRTASLGALASRPGVAELYMGIRTIEGPISSNIASTYLRYRMTEKWIGAFGVSLDLGPAGSIGQSLELTRIGESFLVTMGVTVDEGRDNVGFRFALEPRFLASGRRGVLGGERIPPAGMLGLE